MLWAFSACLGIPSRAPQSVQVSSAELEAGPSTQESLQGLRTKGLKCSSSSNESSAMDAEVLGLSLFIKLAGSGCSFGSHSPEQAAEPVITRDFSKLESPEAVSIISRFGYGKLGGRKAGSGRSLCQAASG